MRFYSQPHRFYCGVDLHARTLSLRGGGLFLTRPFSRLTVFPAVVQGEGGTQHVRY